MTPLTATAEQFRSRIRDESRFLETCEGGDPGTPEHPSIWVLGIEPGWSLADNASVESDDDARSQALEQYDVKLQLGWPYNRNAFKLLAALAGVPVEHYVQFAERMRPFERGSKGYFKANLFPEPFNKVGEWDDNAVKKTGFPTKDDYKGWQRQVRFAVLRSWIAKCKPQIVIGTGLTHLDDFLNVTGTLDSPVAYHFEVNGYPKRLLIAKSGIVPVAVVPHLSGGSHGLNSDEATRVAASLIRAALGSSVALG